MFPNFVFFSILPPPPQILNQSHRKQKSGQIIARMTVPAINAIGIKLYNGLLCAYAGIGIPDRPKRTGTISIFIEDLLAVIIWRPYHPTINLNGESCVDGVAW